jgi:hypothetical protein
MRRREFLGVLALPLMPRRAPHPILSTVEPVVERAHHLRVHVDKIDEVAGWMAYESLPWPDFRSPLVPEGNDSDTMDFLFLTSTINFAFTDFEKHVVFRTSYDGRDHFDSDAMMACLKRAWEADVPVLQGRYLKSLTRADLGRIFSGNVEMPMLDERLAIFHEVGKVLDEHFRGRFHRFVASGPRRVEPLLERLKETFPSFRDESDYRGKRVRFDKRAQLLLWQLHARFRGSGFFALEDPEELTIFADYIVPVALRLLGITSYSEALEEAILERRRIPRGGEEEVEIRAAAIWACHRLTRAINERRPPERQVIDPVVDGRLWTHYHETHWPHHLTVTTAY